jgi:hypothetical protein
VKRERIYSALFAKLSAISGLVTISRRLKHYDDVAPTEQPAMFVTQGNQFVRQIKGLPSQYTLDAKIWLYTYDPDPTKPPAQMINDIMDQVDEILKPTAPDDKQTLGGLVDHCWIEGEIITDEGTLGDQSVAIFTIKNSITT